MITFDMLLAGGWKSAAVLGAAFAASWILRRTSAALRHFLWTAAFAVLLILPLVKSTRQVRIAAPSIATTVVAAAAPSSPAPQSAPVPWAMYIWVAGAAIAFMRFAIGGARVAWLARRARQADYAERIMREHFPAARVRVLDSPAIPIPLAWGLLQPEILLPKQAREWPLERLLTVLRHELAHISRGDLATQFLAQAACSLYWFQPLAWLAARAQRHERELACDDAVLSAGLAAHEYASHLLEVTRSLGAKDSRGLNAPAMAAPGLEARVRSLFVSRDRRPLRVRVALAVAAVLLAVGLPVATLHVYGQNLNGTLAGVVQDPSGSRIPACSVEIKNLDGSNEERTSCNSTGEFRFTSIPQGRYMLTVIARGFKKLNTPTVVNVGTAARVDARLELGDVTEVVTVTGPKAVPTGMQQPMAAGRIKIGGMVEPAALIFGPKPAYPANPQQPGAECTVMIRAIIGKDGIPINPTVINTVADPTFRDAAMSAVSKWRYRPSMLNGEPVETTTTISVEFKPGQ
jgi:TonB family protein